MGPVGYYEKSVTTILLCVRSLKSEDLIYTLRKPDITPGLTHLWHGVFKLLAYSWLTLQKKALLYHKAFVDSSWNVMAHGDAREGKWRGNWRMECVASNLHIISEHGVSSITTADAHTSAASSRLNRRPRRFKWTRPFRRKTRSVFCACAITFQLASTDLL